MQAPLIEPFHCVAASKCGMQALRNPTATNVGIHHYMDNVGPPGLACARMHILLL